jgi:hypothetical protein
MVLGLTSNFKAQNKEGWFNFDNYTCYMQGTKIDPADLSIITKDYWQQSTYMGVIDASGLKYYKVNSNLEFSLNGIPSKQFLIRESALERKVYIRSLEDEAKEFLLYDFNVGIGDTIRTVLTEKLTDPLVVKEIVFVNHNGVTRKELLCTLQGKTTQRTIRFIEGVGTNQGFIVPIDLATKEAVVLKCAYQNGEVILSTDKSCPDTSEMYKRKSSQR